MKGSATNFRVKNTFIECEGDEANDACLLPEPASPGHAKWKTCPAIRAAALAGTPPDEEEEEEELAEAMPLDGEEGEHPVILGKQFAPCKEDVKLDMQEDLGASTSTAARAPRVSFSTAGESEDLDASTSTAARARRVCFSAAGESEEDAMARSLTTENTYDDLAPTPRAGRRFCGTEDLRERLLETEGKAAGGGAAVPSDDDDGADADSAASPRRFRGFARTEDLRESFADTTFKQRLAGEFGGERTAVWAQSLEKEAEDYTSTVADDASLPGQYPHMAEDHRGTQRNNLPFQQGHGAAHPAAGSAGSWFPGGRAAPSKLYLPTAACGARGAPFHHQAAGQGAHHNGGAPPSPTWQQGSAGAHHRNQAMLYGAHRAEAPVSSAACLCMPFAATSGYGARNPLAGIGAQSYQQSMPTSRPVHTGGESPTNNIYSTAVPVSFHAVVPRSYGSAAPPPPPPPMPPQAYGLAQMSACCMQYQQNGPAGGAPIPSMPHFIMGPGGQPQLAMHDLGSPVHAALPAPCAFSAHLTNTARMAMGATGEEATQAAGFEGSSVANPRRASNRRLRLWAHIYLHMQVPGYDLVPRLIGRGGKNMRRIADETGAKLRIRGRGSGHFEIDGQFEAPTPLMVAVTTDKCDREAFRLAISSTLKVLRRAEEEFTIFCKQRNIVHEGPAFSIGLLPEGAREVLAEILDGVPDADLGSSKRR